MWPAASPRSEERRVDKEGRYWRDWSSDVCSSDPSDVNWEAALYDHMCAMLLFWSCAITPGENVASSVTTCDDDGISAISSCEMTVPLVAAVVSISEASAVTSTVWVEAPICNVISTCFT